MSKTASLNIRVEPEVKAAAGGIFSHFGLSLADAVSIFLHKSIIVGGMPFDMVLPPINQETLDAMQEACDIMSGKIQSKAYSSLAELNSELDAEYEEEYGNV